MRRYLPVVSLLALGVLPGCVFAVDSGSYQDSSRVAKLEKRVKALESRMESCGEECCTGEKDDDAPKSHAEAPAPKPASGKS